MKLVTPEERLEQKSGVKAVIAGRPGVGKTTLLLGLDPKKTVFVDLEAGDLSVKSYKGATIQPNSWNDCKNVAVLAGGPNPAIISKDPSKPKAYSQEHYDMCVKHFPDQHKVLQECDTIFIDSITVAARLALMHARQLPENFTKSGAIDSRQAYGSMGQEMMQWLIFFQHIRLKNVIFCCILEEGQDEMGRVEYKLQMEGKKSAQELPGIVDQVIIYDYVNSEDKDGNMIPTRTFICKPEGHIFAKSRAKNVSIYESPDLNALLNKLSNNQITGEK